MSGYAMMIGGSLAFASPRPITVDGIQHPPGVFRLWTDAALAAIGVWRVDRAPVPAGTRATGWTLAVEGNRVVATPDVEPIPPQPVTITAEQLAAFLAPPATDGEGLIVGRWYAEGAVVTEDGATYDVTRPFLYANAEWRPEHLAAHLARRPEDGGGGVPAWAVGLNVVVGEVYSHNGQQWRVRLGHLTQEAWAPGGDGLESIWEGPI